MRPTRLLALAGIVLLAGACATAPPRPAPPPEPAPPPPPPPPPEAQARIVLRGVNFAFGSDRVEESSMVVLEVAAETLAGNPGVRVRVEGHTDSVGPAAYNQALSERRAAAVRRILIEQGVAADRLTSRGFGESRPVASNETDDGRRLNRRVELVPEQ